MMQTFVEIQKLKTPTYRKVVSKMKYNNYKRILVIISGLKNISTAEG